MTGIHFGQNARWYCEQPTFRTYLSTQGAGAVPDSAAAASALKRLLDIRSADELNHAGRAQDLWLEMTGGYAKYMRGML